MPTTQPLIEAGEAAPHSFGDLVRWIAVLPATLLALSAAGWVLFVSGVSNGLLVGSPGILRAALMGLPGPFFAVLAAAATAPRYKFRAALVIGSLTIIAMNIAALGPEPFEPPRLLWLTLAASAAAAALGCYYASNMDRAS